MVTLRMKYLIQGATFIVIMSVAILKVILLSISILIVPVLSAYMRHYDNTYKELIYDDFTYNINKCYITYMFVFTFICTVSAISKISYK
jgi:hypothetical protein